MTESTAPNGDNETAQTEAKPNWRRDLEARAKAGDEAQSKLAAYERREVFRDAGLDPSDKMTGYFIKGYDGDLTTDAIRAEAAAAGIQNGETSTVVDPALGEALQTESRIAEAAGDAGPVTNPDLDALIRETTNEDELRALMETHGFEFGAAE